MDNIVKNMVDAAVKTIAQTCPMTEHFKLKGTNFTADIRNDDETYVYLEQEYEMAPRILRLSELVKVIHSVLNSFDGIDNLDRYAKVVVGGFTTDGCPWYTMYSGKLSKEDITERASEYMDLSKPITVKICLKISM